MTTPVTASTARPAPVSLAVKLMYAIAGLDVLGLIFTVANTSTLRDQARASAPSLTGSQLDAAVTAAIVIGVVSALIGAALWILFAIFVGRGRNWARIVVTVLAALVVLSGLFSLSGGVTLPEVVTLLAAACAVGVLVLLYRRESGRYFAGAQRAQLADPAYPGYPPVQ